MPRSLTAFAAALAIVAFTAGSAFAGCGHSSQSVSLESQSASTSGQVSTKPKPAESSD